MVDGMQKDGLTDAYDNNAMGVCADLCATEYNFSREDQDNFAIQSYERSAKAWETGKFDNEIVPVAVPQRKGDPIIVSKDEEFTNVKLDRIPSLNAVFTKDGTVTAANASSINDGAAALVVTSDEIAEARGLKPLAKIIAHCSHAQEPDWFTTAPAEAIKKECDICGNSKGFKCNSSSCKLSKKTKSLFTVIRRHCLDCVPEKTPEAVKSCSGRVLSPFVHVCPLHPFRTG